MQQGRAGSPFSSDPEAGKEAKDRENRDRRRKTATGGENRIGQDGETQSANAPDAIGEPTPEHRASPAEHEDRKEEAAIGRDIGFARLDRARRKQVRERRHEHEPVEPGVETVEHPARPRGPEHPCGRGLGRRRRQRGITWNDGGSRLGRGRSSVARSSAASQSNFTLRLELQKPRTRDRWILGEPTRPARPCDDGSWPCRDMSLEASIRRRFGRAGFL